MIKEETAMLQVLGCTSIFPVTISQEDFKVK